MRLKCLIVGEQQYFHLGRRFSNHKMTGYSKNLEGHGPPGYAYATKVNLIKWPVLARSRNSLELHERVTTQGVSNSFHLKINTWCRRFKVGAYIPWNSERVHNVLWVCGTNALIGEFSLWEKRCKTIFDDWQVTFRWFTRLLFCGRQFRFQKSYFCPQCTPQVSVNTLRQVETIKHVGMAFTCGEGGTRK